MLANPPTHFWKTQDTELSYPQEAGQGLFDPTDPPARPPAHLTTGATDKHWTGLEAVSATRQNHSGIIAVPPAPPPV